MFKSLNKKLKQYLNEEAAMYKSNQPTLEDFYNYVIKNPKAKESYFIPTGLNIRIPSNTILHDFKKHNMGVNDWNYCIKNIRNIKTIGISRKTQSGNNMFLININNLYGVSLMDCPQFFYITTIFREHPNSINSWIDTHSKEINFDKFTKYIIQRL